MKCKICKKHKAEKNGYCLLCKAKHLIAANKKNKEIIAQCLNCKSNIKVIYEKGLPDEIFCDECKKYSPIKILKWYWKKRGKGNKIWKKIKLVL